MADPGDGPGGSVPPLCLDENEARRAETTFFFRRLNQLGTPISIRNGSAVPLA